MTHISTLRLHQLRLGELEPAARAPLEDHLASCALCAGRLGHQDAARAEFVRTPVPAAILPAPSFWERMGRLRAIFLLVPVAIAAALVLRAPLDEPTERTKGEAPLVRAKGSAPVLEAWIQTGESARPVYSGERVGAGTRVQLKYDPGAHRFVTLAGRDARGTVEVYGTLPTNGPGLAAAPFALTLDDAAGDQEFYAVLTDTRPAPEEVVDALTGDVIRVEHGEIASVVLAKE